MEPEKNPHLDRDLIRVEADSIAKVLKEIGIEAAVAHAGGRWFVRCLIPETEASYNIVSFRDVNMLRFALHDAAKDTFEKHFQRA